MSGAGRQRRRFHLVVCGGGASAVLLARALTRNAPRALRVTIIEPRSPPGAGLAYGTFCDSHLLNVRARRMSVDCDDPDHFIRWLETHQPKPDGSWVPSDFVPRRYFGAYLHETLRVLAERRGNPSAVIIERTTATAIAPKGRRWAVSLENGRTLSADTIVIATGNEKPSGIETAVAGHAILNDPWDAAAKAAIPKKAAVLIVGTALTAVDIAIELLDNGHLGQIFAVSRRGFLPQVHALPPFGAEPWLKPPYPTTIRALYQTARRRVRATDGPWQNEIDALRPILPALWSGLSLVERRRFFRHVQSIWDVHRHRIAPAIHARLAAALRHGQIVVSKGRLTTIELVPGRPALRATVASAQGTRSVQVERIINCTGPNADPAKSENILIRSLLRDGLARPDALGIGLDVDQDSRVIAENGTTQPTLFALGPITRGRFWEITALPEIREQANRLSEVIAALAEQD